MIYQLVLKKYAKMNATEIAKLAVDNKIVTPKFLYSKLQVTQLMLILESLDYKNKRSSS